MGGVGDIDDRGAGGRAHVADEGSGAGDDDLAAARAIEISDLAQAVRGTHGRLLPMRRDDATIMAAEKAGISAEKPGTIIAVTALCSRNRNAPSALPVLRSQWKLF